MTATKLDQVGGSNFEKMVLALLLKDKSFCGSYAGLLQSTHFSTELFSALANVILGFYAKYRRVPNYDELVNAISRRYDADQTTFFDACISLVESLWEAETPSKDYISPKLISFIKEAETLSLLQKASKEQNLNPDYLYKELQRITSMTDDVHDMGLTSDSFIEKLLTRDEESEGFTTGFPSFDHVLKHGFRPGELTVIQGGSGIGKTTVLCNLGKGLLLSGAKVVHITLEMPEERIMDKYISSLTRIPIDKLNDTTNMRDIVDQISQTSVISPTDLRIKYMEGNSATLNDIENYIVRLRSAGHGIDILIVDYADLVRPPRNYGQSGDKRLELGDIYVGLRNMGERFGFPILTVSQINREGKKLGFNYKTGRYDAFPAKLRDFHMDDSQKKANHADFIFAIREPKVFHPFDSDGQSFLFVVDAIKTRYGEKDQCLVFNMRFCEAWMEDRTEGFDFENCMDWLRTFHTLEGETKL